jgi:hypothetical protein
MSTKLHEAVHRTTNKLLDSPDLIKLTDYDDPSPLESRLIAVLKPLGYVELGFLSPTNPDLFWRIHPLALKHFKRYGEQYVLMLEATQRLTQ